MLAAYCRPRVVTRQVRFTTNVEGPVIRRELKQCLHDHFEIAHATIEMETDAEQCADDDRCHTH